MILSLLEPLFSHFTPLARPAHDATVKQKGTPFFSKELYGVKSFFASRAHFRYSTSYSIASAVASAKADRISPFHNVTPK